MPPGPNVFQQVGARPAAEPRRVPLFNNRFFSGLWTQRNILRDPAGVVQERWYGGKPDALLDGLNVEITNRLTPARAPGSTVFSTVAFPQPADSFYSFRQFTGSSESITVMADTAGVLYSVNPTSKTTVLTKGSGAGQAFMIGVNNTLYIGDGVEQMAWQGSPASVRNWGIAISSMAVPSIKYAGAAADTGSSWTNPTNVEGAPGHGSPNYAVCATGYTSSALNATAYAFGVATGVAVKGVQVTIYGHVVGPGYSGTVSAQLLVGGVPAGQKKQVFINDGFPDASYVLGGSADTWGLSLTPAQVNASGGGADFGVQITFTSAVPGSTATLDLNSLPIQVFAAQAPAVALVAGGFSPAPSTGYKYVIMYGNGSTVFSVASPQSSLIKPDATHSVQVSLIASSDPQVNQIWVLRTEDGGATFYNLPTSPYPNTTANITDSAADSTLELFQQADITGLNTPPPAGLTAFEFHMGRIWGVVQNTLYYSVGPDLGLILGSPYEGFPPANFFTFSSRIVRLLSISTVAGAGLLVFTTSDVYVILGNASAAAALAGATGLTVFYAAPLLRKVGLGNYNGLDARGAIVYMMTSDGRLISFNPSSQIIYTNPEQAINEIGFPIGAAPPAACITLTGGSLASFNPASTYVSWHGSGSADQALYVSDGSTGWFRCNANQQPDGGSVWSPKRNITGGCVAVQSIETSPGVYQLLIGTTNTNNPIWYRDPARTNYSDDGNTYDAFIRVGAMVLAQPGQIANVDFVTLDLPITAGSAPTVKILFSELDGTFTTLAQTANDPPQLAAPATLWAARYAARQAASGTQPPAAGRYMQTIVDFGLEQVQDEILSLTVFGSYTPEA